MNNIRKIQYFIEELKSRDKYVRRTAVQALGKQKTLLSKANGIFDFFNAKR
jgi:HEAT repeat protein